mmetsp:Transcript_15302/g.32601  ORF Transcript_15302/g.32601 Transcript_15302/m.32601 type:complete len:218 (-) Transcript_15302:288-941(-)
MRRYEPSFDSHTADGRLQGSAYATPPLPGIFELGMSGIKTHVGAPNVGRTRPLIRLQFRQRSKHRSLVGLFVLVVWLWSLLDVILVPCLPSFVCPDRVRRFLTLHLVELLAQDGNVVAERADRVLATDAQVVVQPAVDVVHAEELTCASARGRAQARGWAQDEWTGRRLAARMRVCNRAWQHQTCTGRCGLERSESRYENRRADLVRASLLGVISKE